MNTVETIGGVSPLQKRRTKSYAGSAGVHATTRGSKRGSARRRRGFSRSGSKGVNVHGYTGQTRFKHTAKAGPLAPATTAKTGGDPSSSSSSSGGGDYGGTNSTYHIDNSVTSGDDYSRHLSIDDRDVVNQSITKKDKVVNQPKVSNETTNKTEIENINKPKQENINKTKQNIKTKETKKTFTSIWQNNEKGVQGKYKTFEEFKKAAIAWNNSTAGKKYWANKNKTTQINEANQQNTSNVENITENTTDASNVQESNLNVGDINTGANVDTESFFNSPNNFNSPNKMKSHAWDMQQGMINWRKGRGGTSK